MKRLNNSNVTNWLTVPVVVAIAVVSSSCSSRRVVSNISTDSAPQGVQTTSCLPARYPIEEAKARASVLQITCKRLGINDLETEKADSLMSVFSLKRSETTVQDRIVQLEYASTLYELALARDQITQHEATLTKLEQQLEVFQEIVDELEKIGTR